MRADAYIAAMRVLPLAGLDSVTGGQALILAPHPDDESLGCGGLIAEACARGEPPILAVLTDGAGSHPNSIAYPPDRLRLTREAETIAAVACLGLDESRVVFLRSADTSAPTDGPGLEELASRIAELVRVHACTTILASWEHDPHCDHVAAHLIAARAAQMTGIVHRAYPVWGLTLTASTELPGAPGGMRLDIARHLPAKRRAILSHASQYSGLIGDDPTGFQMQPDFMALFDKPAEIYLDVTP